MKVLLQPSALPHLYSNLYPNTLVKELKFISFSSLTLEPEIFPLQSVATALRWWLFGWDLLCYILDIYRAGTRAELLTSALSETELFFPFEGKRGRIPIVLKQISLISQINYFLDVCVSSESTKWTWNDLVKCQNQHLKRVRGAETNSVNSFTWKKFWS